MSTLIVAVCHPGAQEIVLRNGTTWSRGGADVAGVEHDDKPGMVWPPCVRLLARIGTDPHRTVNGLADRFLSVATWCANMSSYDQFCFIEPDVVLLRPVPGYSTMLRGTLAGGGSPRFASSKFFHFPWIIPAIKIPLLLDRAGRLIRAGLLENKFTDRWLGLMSDLYPELHVEPTGNYTRNVIEGAEALAQAAEAVRRPDCWAIHGVKSQEAFDTIASVFR